jgi:3-methylfumaryl-CoA hydratase
MADGSWVSLTGNPYKVFEMDVAGDLEMLADPAAGWRQGAVESRGTVTADSVRVLAECLGGPLPATSVPPLWWLPEPAPWAPLSDLSSDGHPTTGVGYPPIPDRRRLFAGGRLEVVSSLPVGAEVTRVTRVIRAKPAQTRSGPMLFATLEHRYLAGGGLVAIAEDDIAYRSGSLSSTQAAPEHAPEPVAGPRLSMVPNEVHLFRFSALTGNAHRIHYDRPYAERVEHLPGLLVHGPLLALLLLELPRRAAPERTVRAFEFRLRRPVTAGTEVVSEVVTQDAGKWQVRAVAAGAVVATGEVALGD